MKQIYYTNKVQEILDNQLIPERPGRLTLKEIVVDTVITIVLDAVIVAGLLYGINEQQKINEIENQQYKQTYPEAYKNVMEDK